MFYGPADKDLTIFKINFKFCTFYRPKLLILVVSSTEPIIFFIISNPDV